MVSIQDTEVVQVGRMTQDTYDLAPPLSWDTSGESQLKKDSVDLGRVHITWESDGEFAEVTVVAWKRTFDHKPYISDLYPSLLTLFKPLIDATRPTGTRAPEEPVR
jgi:hypothetical protein